MRFFLVFERFLTRILDTIMEGIIMGIRDFIDLQGFSLF